MADLLGLTSQEIRALLDGLHLLSEHGSPGLASWHEEGDSPSADGLTFEELDELERKLCEVASVNAILGMRDA